LEKQKQNGKLCLRFRKVDKVFRVVWGSKS